MKKHTFLTTFSILVILMSCSDESLSPSQDSSNDSIPSYSISSEMSIESETDSSFVDSSFIKDSSSDSFPSDSISSEMSNESEIESSFVDSSFSEEASSDSFPSDFISSEMSDESETESSFVDSSFSEEVSSDSFPSDSISSEMSNESEIESSFVDSSFSEESSSEEIIETFDPYEQYWTYGGSYYDSLDFSLTDDEMKEALSNLINDGAENSSYSGLRSAYKYTDVDPENENNIILYYTGESRAFKYGDSSAFQGSINREHVWPQSRYASLGKKQHNTPYDDIYNVRPADKNTNSSRGNGLFDYGLNEPENDSYKGDVARVLLYVATRYTTLSLVDNTTGGTNSMGKLSTLLEWNLKYPVTDVEIRRNNGGQKVQNNRNPFVDNPHFACAIWGSTNSATRKVCQASYQEIAIARNTIAYKDYFSSSEKNDIYILIENKKKK